MVKDSTYIGVLSSYSMALVIMITMVIYKIKTKCKIKAIWIKKAKIMTISSQFIFYMHGKYYI